MLIRKFCFCVKLHEWDLWQRAMVFTLIVCVFKNRKAKSESKADVKCECTFMFYRCSLTEGRYKCPSCPKTYNSKESVKLHMWTHIGKKPYECEVCGKTFGRLDSLKKHTVVHSGTYSPPHLQSVTSKSFHQLACQD